MLIMLECNNCRSLNNLDVTDCHNCESHLIDENVELHAEYEPGIISATNMFTKHNPTLDGYLEGLEELQKKKFINKLKKKIKNEINQNILRTQSTFISFVRIQPYS